jgi:hypothetical protein
MPGGKGQRLNSGKAIAPASLSFHPRHRPIHDSKQSAHFLPGGGMQAAWAKYCQMDDS